MLVPGKLFAFFIPPLLRSQLRHRRAGSPAAAVKASSKVKHVKARQIVDSRGNPTVEVDLITEDDSLYRSAVPSGASTRIYEALDLRDGDKTVYGGKGVLNAVKNINDFLSPKLGGIDVRYTIDFAGYDLARKAMDKNKNDETGEPLLQK